MDNLHLSADLVSELPCPFERGDVTIPGIEGAHDPSETDGVRFWDLLHVNAGPNRALSIMEYFRGNRPEQEAAERPVAVRRHHNQVRLFEVGVLHNLAGRVPVQQSTFDVEVPQLIDKKSIHLVLGRV